MSVADLIKEPSPMQEADFGQMKPAWQSAPQIGNWSLGPDQIAPKSLTDRQVRNLVLDTNGFIRGGQTAYNTGTGFFLGYSTDAYKFSIGNPTGNYLTWDGTTLTIAGSLTVLAGNAMKTNGSNSALPSGLSDIDADLGTITAGTYLTGATVGQAGGPAGVKISSSGVEGYSGGTTKEFYLQSSDGKAYFAGGNAVIDGAGLRIKGSASANNYASFWTAFTDNYPFARVWADTNSTALALIKTSPTTGAIQSMLTLFASGAVSVSGAFSSDTSATSPSFRGYTAAFNSFPAIYSDDPVAVFYGGNSGNNGWEVKAQIGKSTGIYPGSQSTNYIAGGTRGIGINGTPDAYGALDIQSTTGALIIPRMTTTQRDAMTAVAGMIIYNTTSGAFNRYTSSWNAF